MRITSEEIAKLANVSRSTVSRVVNNYSNVPEETRKKVMEIIEKYGYSPNMSARVLAGKASQEILVCNYDYHIERKRDKEIKSLYFMRLISELIAQSKKYGYIISVFEVSNSSDYIKIENMFLNREISGGIFIGFEFQMKEINELISKGFNMVVIYPDDTVNVRDNVKGIYSENEEAAYLATRYLLDKGHRKIAHIAGDGRLSGRERLKGYLKAMREAGIDKKKLKIEEGKFDVDLSYTAAKKLLSSGEVEAIFAASDFMAIAAMRAANDMGLTVPGDIDIIGCDHVSTFEDVGIHLTSVDIPIREIAKTAVDAVLNLETQQTYKCKAVLKKGNTA